MTVGLVLTAFGLGLRHGIDWDHIAAIADLSSTAETRRRGVWLSTLYAVGHAAVILALGGLAIVFGASLPEGVDLWMGRVVGVTLIVLGVWVIVELLRKGKDFRLRSRWGLLLGERRPGHGHGDEQSAAGIGVLHGIGFESPTQIAVFVASTSLVGAWAGISLLLAWVFGLVMANTLLAVLAAYGLLGAERNFTVYAAVAVVVAIASVAMGLYLLLGVDPPLPELN